MEKAFEVLELTKTEVDCFEVRALEQLDELHLAMVGGGIGDTILV